MGIVMTKLKFKCALIMGSIMLLDLAGHSFIAFRNKKGIFAKIGYLIIFISFALWILWHGITIYKMYKEPVVIVVQPLGYDKPINHEKMQVVSNVKLKNISFHPIDIQVRLYLKDTMRELQESTIQSIELWEKRREEKETKITEDLHVIIPPKEETGLYIQAVYENSEGIYFPYHTEQEIKIIYETMDEDNDR